MREFSLTNFFLVTGLSFLAFTGAMKLLDGTTIRILLKIGLASLALGVLAVVIKFLFSNRGKSNSRITKEEGQNMF